MKVVTWCIISLLGTAQGRVHRLNVDIRDSQLQTAKGSDGYCLYGWDVKSLADYEAQLKTARGELCRYFMTRNYSAEVTHLFDEGKPISGPFATFQIHLHAPRKLQTYIHSIRFSQQKKGSNCQSFRLSQLPRSDAEVLLPYTAVQTDDETKPEWRMSDARQIMDGDYLLEVPSTCLVEPTNVYVRLSYVYEVEAATLRQIEGSGVLRAVSKECTFPTKRMRIESYELFQDLIREQPKECLYEYKRNYTMILVAYTGGSQNTRITIVSALSEAMFANQERTISTVQFGPLVGPNCVFVKAYAQKKGPEGAARFPMSAHLKFSMLGADIPEGYHTTDWEYVFLLKADCVLPFDAVIEYGVIDRNWVTGQLFPEYPSEKLARTFVSLSAESPPRRSAQICKYPLPHIPKEITPSALDLILDDLQPQCIYTYKERWTFEGFRNWRIRPGVERKVNVALTQQTIESILRNYGHINGTKHISRIHLGALSCAYEPVTLTLMDKLTTWGDFDKSATHSKQIPGMVTSDSNNYDVYLTPADGRMGGYVVELPLECFPFGDDISGNSWTIETTTRVVGARGSMTLMKDIPKAPPPTLSDYATKCTLQCS